MNSAHLDHTCLIWPYRLEIQTGTHMLEPVCCVEYCAVSPSEVAVAIWTDRTFIRSCEAGREKLRRKHLHVLLHLLWVEGLTHRLHRRSPVWDVIPSSGKMNNVELVYDMHVWQHEMSMRVNPAIM